MIITIKDDFWEGVAIHEYVKIHSKTIIPGVMRAKTMLEIADDIDCTRKSTETFVADIRKSLGVVSDGSLRRRVLLVDAVLGKGTYGELTPEEDALIRELNEREYQILNNLAYGKKIDECSVLQNLTPDAAYEERRQVLRAVTQSKYPVNHDVSLRAATLLRFSQIHRAREAGDESLFANTDVRIKPLLPPSM